LDSSLPCRSNVSQFSTFENLYTFKRPPLLQGCSTAGARSGQAVKTVETGGSRASVHWVLMRVPATPPKTVKYKKLPASTSTAEGCTTHMGDTPGHHRGATGQTPLALARRNSGRTGWKQRKCGNCNSLRDRPEVLCLCLHVRSTWDTHFGTFYVTLGQRRRSRAILPTLHASTMSPKFGADWLGREF
jgi:hypothetical protein